MAKTKTASTPEKPIVLQLIDVSKTYQVGEEVIQAMRHVSLTVHQGEFVAVIGPSGSGKSTFLQISSMLAEPSSGKILLHNKEVGQYNEVERAHLRNQEIGFIFQQFNLLPRTSSVDNVALPLVYAKVGAAERRRRATQVLQDVGLGDRLQNTPAQLSGGQQQRVAIARALVNQPSLVFADEPTGNLDSVNSQEIKEQLIKLNQEGKTIIIVTHDQDVADITRRIITFRDGQIISDQPNTPQDGQVYIPEFCAPTHVYSEQEKPDQSNKKTKTKK